MVWLAEKTLHAIDTAIVEDKGTTFRLRQQQVLPAIGDAYAPEGAVPRGHLGASAIGNPCERAIWYGWRWASYGLTTFGKKSEEPTTGEARIRRLWNRGHLEEGRFISLLLAANITVVQQQANGKQFRFSDLNGHFAGSGDGFACNVPDLPAGMWVTLEFKTHNEKSFDSLVAKGLFASKITHYTQCQQYSARFNMPATLYMAVNKNTDALYAEIVQTDVAFANSTTDKAQRILNSNQPPSRIRNASPGYFECKFCDHYLLCWGKRAPKMSCRTCAFARPSNNGLWCCTKYNVDGLTVEQQFAGCQSWEAIKGIGR